MHQIIQMCGLVKEDVAHNEATRKHLSITCSDTQDIHNHNYLRQFYYRYYVQNKHNHLWCTRNYENLEISVKFRVHPPYILLLIA